MLRSRSFTILNPTLSNCHIRSWDFERSHHTFCFSFLVIQLSIIPIQRRAIKSGGHNVLSMNRAWYSNSKIIFLYEAAALKDCLWWRWWWLVPAATMASMTCCATMGLSRSVSSWVYTWVGLMVIIKRLNWVSSVELFWLLLIYRDVA